MHMAPKRWNFEKLSGKVFGIKQLYDQKSLVTKQKCKDIRNFWLIEQRTSFVLEGWFVLQLTIFLKKFLYLNSIWRNYTCGFYKTTNHLQFLAYIFSVSTLLFCKTKTVISCLERKTKKHTTPDFKIIFSWELMSTPFKII